jgi:hypothetical protein
MYYYIINVMLYEKIISVHVFDRRAGAQGCAYDWSVNKSKRLGFRPKFGEFKTYVYKVERNTLCTHVDSRPLMVFY